MRSGNKVFVEVVVVCESEFAMESLDLVTIVWCSESLIEVLVMLNTVSETELGRISWLCT